MGLFSKSKKGEAQSSPSSKKKMSNLAQIFHESVVSTAIDIFKQNDMFVHRTADDEEEYIGIILDTASIGGLDKKSKKDEAKGSIIECINSGRLSAFITPDLMDMEYICFIPNVTTVECMSEFSLLMNAPYEFCKVSEDGDVLLLNKKTTYTEIKELIETEGSINDILGDNKLDDGASDKDDDDIPEFNEDDDSFEKKEYDDDVDEIPEDVEGDDSFEIPELPEEYEETDVPSANTESNTDSALDDAYAAAFETEIMPEQTVTPEMQEAAVTRRFYSSELDIDISSDPFDAQFMQTGDVARFDTQRPAGWMNEQLNEIARQANTELDNIHKKNIWQLRDMYFRLCTSNYENVRNTLDIATADTNYGQMVFDLKAEKAGNIEKIDIEVSKRKQEVEQRWQQRLKEVGMEAARKAQHSYKEKHSKEHDEEMFNIEKQVRASIEADFNDRYREILNQRVREGRILYDLAVTEVLDECARMYTVYSQEEHAKYTEYAKMMQNFADECRKDDKARTEVLKEDLAQQEKADKVLAEQTKRMETFAAEQKVQREKLLSELDEQKKSFELRIDNMRKDKDEKIEQLERDLDAANKRYDDMANRLAHADDIAARKYEARIEEMRQEIIAARESNDKLSDSTNQKNKMVIFVAIMAVMCALAFGAIIGYSYSNKTYTDNQTQKIFEQYTQSDSQNGQIAEDAPETAENGSNKEEW